MAIEPAAISARPAVTMTAVVATAPESPAARANGTVRPSDIPMTMSRTVLPAVKCFSTWGVCGMSTPVEDPILLDLPGGVVGRSLGENEGSRTRRRRRSLRRLWIDGGFTDGAPRPTLQGVDPAAGEGVDVGPKG